MKNTQPLVVLPMQQEVLATSSRITLLTAGAGAGSTYALYISAVLAGESHVSFVSPTYKLAHVHFDTFCKEFAVKFGWRISKSSLIITTDTGTKIKFTSHVDGLYNLKGLILIDQAHNFPQVWLDHHLGHRSVNPVILTSKPYECGWRSPLYENGILQKDENGVIIYTDKSWDHSLVNWKKQGELCFVGNKATPDDYKVGVSVVSGYNVEDNYYLMRSNPTYKDFLDELPSKEQKRLSGAWIM